MRVSTRGGCGRAGIGRLVPEGQSLVPLLTDKLIEELPHDANTFARQRRAPLPMPDVSAMQVRPSPRPQRGYPTRCPPPCSAVLCCCSPERYRFT